MRKNKKINKKREKIKKLIALGKNLKSLKGINTNQIFICFFSVCRILQKITEWGRNTILKPNRRRAEFYRKLQNGAEFYRRFKSCYATLGTLARSCRPV